MRGKVILKPLGQGKEKIIIPNALREGVGDIEVRCVSPYKTLFQTLELCKAEEIPLAPHRLAGELLVNENGSRNDEVCDAIIAEYNISSFWCNIFAQNPPDTPIEKKIERKYPNGEIRRILTKEDIIGEMNKIQVSKDGLIPGKHFGYRMTNGVLEFSFKRGDLNIHELPVKNGRYLNGEYPTNLLTGLPDPNGKGPKRKVWFWEDTTAISAIVRWLDSIFYEKIDLNVYQDPRGVLEIKRAKIIEV